MPKGKTFGWWVSWYQPTDDPRPLTWPPHKNILGYWETGYRDSDGAFTLCAYLLACSERIGKRIIKKQWPEAKEWRFFDRAERNEVDEGRFPMSDWMKPRFDNWQRRNRRPAVSGKGE